jgi:oligopeptide transport system substrate-binding protein
LWLSDSGNNRTRWKSPAYDQLVLAARYAQNPAAREKNDIAAQKILLEQDAVIVPLYYEPIMALVRKRVQGLELNPLNYLFLRKVNLVNP